jgi:hypothetical protein
MRTAITPREQLSTTLTILTTGRNYEDLKFSVANSQQALLTIIPDTCKGTYSVLRNQYGKASSAKMSV